jgi:hypothetical protein
MLIRFLVDRYPLALLLADWMRPLIASMNPLDRLLSNQDRIPFQFAFGSEEKAPLIHIEKEGHVVLPSLGRGFIHADAPNVRMVNLGTSRSHVMIDNSPNASIVFTQQGRRNLDRHLSN